eukprot:TRINITY_DN10891_c0_g2_i1.p1 TRINITY_DN10891_c0_g2~~TRINITY_DN10891_c0_g2_i1.p1  ORF type:complete len:283 (+),score=67.43 TRINITY_DN10891_c0_g2_i1:34-882(+)
MTSVRELESLQNELSKVVKHDETYWRQNDAKFRAVAQNATYDQFEEIVKASHLKPLEKKDKSPGNKSKSSIWNSISLSSKKLSINATLEAAQPPAAGTGGSSSHVTGGGAASSHPTLTDTTKSCGHDAAGGGRSSFATKGPIRNIDDFLAAWRDLEIDERIAFLSNLSEEKLNQILSCEIPPELIGDMLHTFLAFRQNPNDIAVVVNTLNAVTSSRRFSLGVQFMSSFDRSTGSQLIEKLLASLPDRQQDLADLGVTEYKISTIAERFQITTRHTVSGPVCK